MNRTSQLFIISLLALIWSVASSFAQMSSNLPKRIALVIGNSSYTKIQSLPNPANDSKLMSQTLGKLGFDVIFASDVDYLGMRRAVKEFGRKLRASGKDTVGLFYYAGHGVQAQGSNFLVPLGAEIADEADLVIEAISASDVLAQMEAAGNTLNMVILDACRNNPYKAKLRSISRGLARVNAASGSLVAFAAAPGQVAADGAGDNSPYTSALVEAMQMPGLTVEQMFKKVRISVEGQTNGRQTPWEESSLRGDFYFNPQKNEPKPVAGVVADPAAQEWATIQNTRSTAVLKAFISRYPKSIYADYARLTLEENVANARLKEKQDESARAAAKKTEELKVANLQRNAPAPSSATQPLAPYEMTILLQSELTRVGCDPGPIDGQWGAKGRRSLSCFKKHTKLELPFKDLSPEVVDAVKQQRARVCPVSTRVKAKKARAGKIRTTKKPRSKRDKRKTWCIKNAKEFDGVAADWC